MSYVAIDIGATNIRVAVGDHQGIKKKKMELTETRYGPIGISNQIIRLIESIRDEEPSSIGIGSIGPINQREGTITNTPNYPFNDIPIAEPLLNQYKVPVTIVNDCTAAVLGERVFGAGQRFQNIVYVTISTGLGGGAIVNDNLLLGKDGNAVEVGHFAIEPESEIICGCGCKGHWEAFSSGRNIPAYAEHLLRGMDWTGGPLHLLTGGDITKLKAETIYTAAKKGDVYAQYIVNQIGRINAIGFANIVNAYDPELITVGGSITLNNTELIIGPIKEHVEKYTINRVPEIMLTPLGQDVVIIGALALAMRV